MKPFDKLVSCLHRGEISRRDFMQKAAAMGLAARSAPLEELDAAVAVLIDEMSANSSESFVAYKDLYRVAEVGLADRLEIEASTDYDFTDTEERLADFR